jgi:hypothetical protein
MTDVTLYVAIVTAGTSVISASIPLAFGWARDIRRDNRAMEKELARELEKDVREKRELCVKLLRLAHDFRALVRNTYDSNLPAGENGLGAEQGIGQIRKSVASIAGRADEVGFMVRGTETAARRLAEAAQNLASYTEEHGLPTVEEPGVRSASEFLDEFDDCLKNFKEVSRAVLDRLQEHSA